MLAGAMLSALCLHAQGSRQALVARVLAAAPQKGN